ncbi:hypothetical protein KI387_022194 [Taxus chinensis]|uniref:U-box domain-containing protein n=1 Tax=Taxus chinensis TaxID=29808 RepID=A0AA38LAI1_TAXCH|nr:hypothetical protein KI387_022194 [Taxus chinensis]
MGNNEKGRRLCNDKRMGSSIPKFFCCPLSGKLMMDPVITDSGITYDRTNIQQWLSNGNIHCSLTGTEISHKLLPHTKLAADICEWKKLYPQLIRDASQNELQWLLHKIKFQDYRCDTFLNNITRLRNLVRIEGWPPQELQKFRPADILADKLSSMSVNHIEGAFNEAAEEIICLFKYVEIDITTVQKMMTPNALTMVSFVLRNSRVKRRIEAMQLINRVAVGEFMFVDQIVYVERVIKGLLEIAGCPLVDCNDKASTMVTVRKLCRRGDQLKLRLKERGCHKDVQ